MILTAFNDFLPEITLFIYYAVKNWWFYKKYRIITQEKKHTEILSLLVAFTSIIFYHLMLKNYDSYSSFGLIKGSIKLPPIWLLFILADILLTVFIIFFIRRTTVKPIPKTIWEVMRLFFLYCLFVALTSFFYAQNISSSMTNKSYWCLKYPLLYELAEFYMENGKYPQTMSEFTSTTVNFMNYAPMEIEYHDWYVIIKDTKGNTIINTADDLIGISVYQEEPYQTEYLDRQKTTRDTLCPSAKSN